jgi:hypothetical protein
MHLVESIQCRPQATTVAAVMADPYLVHAFSPVWVPVCRAQLETASILNKGPEVQRYKLVLQAAAPRAPFLKSHHRQAIRPTMSVSF